MSIRHLPTCLYPPISIQACCAYEHTVPISILCAHGRGTRAGAEGAYQRSQAPAPRDRGMLRVSLRACVRSVCNRCPRAADCVAHWRAWHTGRACVDRVRRMVWKRAISRRNVFWCPLSLVTSPATLTSPSHSLLSAASCSVSSSSLSFSSSSLFSLACSFALDVSLFPSDDEFQVVSSFSLFPSVAHLCCSSLSLILLRIPPGEHQVAHRLLCC